MKNLCFLNYGFKIVGTIILCLSLVLMGFLLVSGSATIWGVYVPEKLVVLLMLVSLMLIIFSKEKNDSELIYQIKQQALFLSLLINLACSIVLIAFLSLPASLWVYYGSLFSIYLFYIVIFYSKKAMFKKECAATELYA